MASSDLRQEFIHRYLMHRMKLDQYGMKSTLTSITSRLMAVYLALARCSGRT